jgi:hypothetical protein
MRIGFQKCILSISISLFMICLLSSCSGVVPLKGTYQDSYTFTSTSSKEKIWDNIVNYFTKNSINITTIDKPSGLIVSNNYAFENSYTREDTLGKLINPNAWIVGNFKPRTADSSGFKIWGNINVHVTEENGARKIEVSITGLGTNAIWFKNSKIASSGVLEKQIGSLTNQ